MKTFNYIVTDPVGLHARPASKLVQELTQFKYSIIIKLGDKSGNAKSIINLMSLGIKNKSEIIFEISGEDEDLAFNSLPEILKKNNI